MPDRSRVERLDVCVGGRSRRQLFSDLSSRGVLINGYAETLLEDVVLDDRASRSVVVTERTVAELGLPAGATLTQIVQAAKQQGLSLWALDTALFCVWR